MDPQPTAAASDAQWRTTCRTCGSSFKSRNQLMRHLYRSHPGKPAKSKASAKAATTKPVQLPPSPPNQAANNPERSQSQVHPFILLSEQQRTVYVARVLSAVFAVCMKQMEEKKGQQEGQEGQTQDQEQHQDTRLDQDHHIGGHEMDHSRKPHLGPPDGGTTSTSDLKSTGPNSAPKGKPSPDQVYQGKLGDDSGSEDSDDDDGGVALFGPTLGSLSLRLHDAKGEVEGLEGDLDLD
jgi:hypothetical protein